MLTFKSNIMDNKERFEEGYLPESRRLARKFMIDNKDYCDSMNAIYVPYARKNNFVDIEVLISIIIEQYGIQSIRKELESDIETIKAKYTS